MAYVTFFLAAGNIIAYILSLAADFKAAMDWNLLSSSASATLSSHSGRQGK